MTFMILAAGGYGPMVLLHAACITGWGFWDIAGVEFLILPMFLALPALLVSLAGLFIRRTRELATCVAGVCAGLLLLFPIVVWASSSLRSYGFLLASRRAEPVIAAVERYEAENGHAPTSLSELAPRYLTELPTGLPPIEIVAGPTAEQQFHGNRWVLSASVSTGVINWDRFMYFPNGEYPEAGYGGWIERIGKWAYVHE